MYNFEDVQEKLGTKYKEWGNDINEGVDCMGLVLHCLRRRGVIIEHLNDRTHKTFDKEVSSGRWKKIDIEKEDTEGRTVVVGFLNEEGEVSHLGVMVSNRVFFHCPDKKGISKSDLARPYWARQRKVFYVYVSK